MNKILTVNTLWIALNPNTHQDLQSRPIQERLDELHQALHKVHASLWVSVKPHTPRYTSKTVQVENVKMETYKVCFNGRSSKEQVVEVVNGFGFISYVEPKPTPIAA